MSHVIVSLRKVIPLSIPKWFAIWTVVGALFSLQLRWHYDLPWRLSLFWGFADYFLWSLIALLIFAGAKTVNDQNWPLYRRIGIYVAAMPVFMALHVWCTMLVGGLENLPGDSDWTGYFLGLFAKKLVANSLTFAILVATGEFLARRRISDTSSKNRLSFVARRGDRSRFITPDQIIWGEVCGNDVNLHTSDGIWPVRKTLTDTLDILPEEGFVRISRSAFVSLASVHSARSSAGKFVLMLSNGAELTVARRQHSSVRKAIRRYRP